MGGQEGACALPDPRHQGLLVGQGADPERDLAVLLVEVGLVAKSGGTGAVFFLDEMQGLSEAALAAVCMAMNRVGQRELPVALVGAGLPPLPRLLRTAKPYAERMFAYHELDRLSDAEARTALVAPAGQHGLAYEPEAIELIVKASAGYPHFIQEYGRVLWNEVEHSPLTAADVEGARALIEEALDRRFFKDRFEMRLTLSSVTWPRWLRWGMARFGRPRSRRKPATKTAPARQSYGMRCFGRTSSIARGGD